MSDESGDGTWSGPNGGVTLPRGANSTHNGGLSSLFTTRIGSNYIIEDEALLEIENRGRSGYLWSSTAIDSGYSYYFDLSNHRSLPSARDLRTFSFSLRCLVSTNNR